MELEALVISEVQQDKVGVRSKCWWPIFHTIRS